jgi:hypothetical protein
MVRFREVSDEKLKYTEVLAGDNGNGRIIGIISTLGFHLLAEQDGSLYLKTADLKLIYEKVAEVEKSAASNSKRVA